MREALQPGCCPEAFGPSERFLHLFRQFSGTPEKKQTKSSVIIIKANQLTKCDLTVYSTNSLSRT